VGDSFSANDWPTEDGSFGDDNGVLDGLLEKYDWEFVRVWLWPWEAMAVDVRLDVFMV